MKKNIFRTYVAVLAAIVSFAIFTQAQTSPSNFPGVKIGNFGQIDEHYYRGAQPLPDDYVSLKALGVNTVVDLRNDPTDYEKIDAEKAGMKYVNIPMSGWKSPKDADIQQFLSLLNSPDTGTVYVHCKAGIHRTGITAAIYRMEKYGWDYDKAYQEMKNYNFTTGLVHGALKSYVKDYSRKVKPAVQTASAESPATATSN
jgi:protein tyrosine/serine phosphatase